MSKLLSFRKSLLTVIAIICAINGAAAQTSNNTDEEIDSAKAFEQAQIAHEKGEYAKALALYEAILHVQPDVAEVEYQRGAALVSLNRQAEAEFAFRHAIELRPSWVLPHVALGSLLMKADKPEGAQLLRRALEIEPNNRQALLALADSRHVAHDKQASLALLRQATSQPDADEKIWLRLALAELEAGNANEALQSFNRLVAFNEKNYNYRLTRAKLMIDSGDLTGALEDLQIAKTSLTSNTNSSKNVDDEKALRDVHEMMATIYAQLGEASRRAEPAKALEFYRKASELAPQRNEYATGFAAALVQARRFAEATIILRRIIAVAPDDYAAHANLAIALDEQGNFREALKEYQWIKQARPELALTDYFIARMHDKLGEYVESLAVYESFMRRADAEKNRTEIERVQLRLESLREQAKKAARSKKKN